MTKLKTQLCDAYDFGHGIVGPLIMEKRYKLAWKITCIYSRKSALDGRQEHLTQKMKKLYKDAFALEYEAIVIDIKERYPD